MKQTRLLVLTALCAACLALPALAAEPWTEVDAAGVKRMLDEDKATVIFPLSRIEFNHEHIPDSVNVPMQKIRSDLPDDKDRIIVFYCPNESCEASRSAASLAAKMGHTNIAVFSPGLPAWKKAGYETVSVERLPEMEIPVITPAELKAMLAGEEDFVLLDIRFGLLARKHFINTPQRINIPLDMLIDRLGELNTGKKVVIMGEVGKRSSVAARYLSMKGFEDISYVEGGMKSWMDEGLPVEER